MSKEKEDYKGSFRFQLTFVLRWTNTKMNEKIEKNVKFIGNRTITETTIVPTYLHLKFFFNLM